MLVSSRKAPQVDAEAVKKGIDAVVSVINDVLSWYYGLLGASNLMMALYVMGGLIVSWIVGSWFDLYTLLFFGTCPPLCPLCAPYPFSYLGS